MKLKDAIQSESWKNKDGIWLNKTVYFCNTRKKNRTKWVKYIEASCDICGGSMLQKKGNEKKYKRKYCSDTCRREAIKKHYKGQAHMSYKGGRYLHEGYVRIKRYGHHTADKHGYVGEHVVIAENSVGRKVKPN